MKYDINNCPLTAALKVVGGKWKPVIVINLNKGPKRFGQLDYLIPDISRKVLASHLAELVEDKLVIKKSHAETPPRVEYELTEKGKELVPIFKSLGMWGRYLIDAET
ncbi:MAG: helix-turn-helix transcriptional regulator [Bacteroidia bacterium]